jgi:hypothetical protein
LPALAVDASGLCSGWRDGDFVRIHIHKPPLPSHARRFAAAPSTKAIARGAKPATDGGFDQARLSGLPNSSIRIRTAWPTNADKGQSQRLNQKDPGGDDQESANPKRQSESKCLPARKAGLRTVKPVRAERRSRRHFGARVLTRSWSCPPPFRHIWSGQTSAAGKGSVAARNFLAPRWWIVFLDGRPAAAPKALRRAALAPDGFCRRRERTRVSNWREGLTLKKIEVGTFAAATPFRDV